MDVDDAELLALAGDSDSDEENSPAPAATTKEASPLPPTISSQTKSKEIPNRQDNSTPNLSTRVRQGASKGVKKARKDDSAEEGEASSTSASHNSLQSAPMSESESESSPADDAGAGGPIFALDNKFYNEKDKKYVMSLSEVQREEILAERAQLVERQYQDQHLRRLLLARESGDKSADKKRKATDLEDSPRKSTRQKTTLGGRKVGETSGAIEAYKRQREEKGLRDQKIRREGANRKDRKARSSSGHRYSSADADGESDVEWDNQKPQVEDYKAHNTPPADFNDVRRATLPRNVFGEYCFYPGFAEAVKDCYVRLPAQGTRNGELTYQLMLIKGIMEKEGFDYAMEKPNGKKFVTNMHAQFMVDGAVKEFHFNGISNSAITEAEVANYKNLMTDEGKPLPTRPFLVAKLSDIDAVVNHRFTEAELQEKLRRSGALQSRKAPAEREVITVRRQEAEERGDEAAIAACDAELATMNGPKLRYGTFLVDPKAQAAPPAEPTQQDRLHELNKSNRQKNREDVRKAQLAERKAEKLAREAVSRGEALQNPFARVKTHAKTHYDVNETLAPHRARQNGNSRDISRAGTPAAAVTPKPEEIKPQLPSPPQKFTASGMPILGNRSMDDDILAAMDFGIDIEI